MKIKVRRSIMLVLLGVILYSASMVYPVLYNSGSRDLIQGCAVGLMIAGIIVTIKTLAEQRKAAK